jgi:phosphoglycerol transferase MdoB-like AlkP superfamily enzyme
MSTQVQIGSNLLSNLKTSFINFWKIGIPFLLVFLLFRIIETKAVFGIHDLSYEISTILVSGLLSDLLWVFYVMGFLLIIYILLELTFPKFGKIVIKTSATLLILLQAGLIFYFTKMLLPLGEDLYAYSVGDVIATVKASGEFNLLNLGASILAFGLIYGIINTGKWLPMNFNAAIAFTVTCYAFIIALNLIPWGNSQERGEIENNLVVNKSQYFYNQSYNYFTNRDYLFFDFYLSPPTKSNLLVEKEFVEPNYPFLHLNNYPDVLSPYFDGFDSIPDLVFIIVEGLGKAYSGESAYLGSFTPFLDSLSEHSLYWKNGLSTTGRTFGVLTGIFGSLPFAQKGFMEQSPDFPLHLSLFSILKQNGYFTNYHIGADKNFDNVGSFLEYQKVDRILDMASFDADFEETPSKSGFSWGYPDKAMFENGMRKIPREMNQPQLSVFQTQTSHDPFLIPDEQRYFDLFEAYISNTLKATTIHANNYRKYRSMYASILYVDEAIKEFFEEYKKMPKYENTIFIITGDHRLPEIPLATTMDRFHVPIMIFSEKLERPKRMHGITTHFEITPTLLGFLKSHYQLNLPALTAWKGYVMDTSAVFQSNITNPLMRNKNQLIDYLSNEYVLSDNQLYRLYDNMDMEPITDLKLKEKLSREFENYRKSNRYATENNRIIPDSLRVYLPVR